MAKAIAIIIVNYNGTRDTVECLQSLDLKSTNYDIFVIDNGSKEEDATIQSEFPDVKYYKIKKNIGFAGANNYGIKKALKDGYRYVMLLNNDTIVDRGFEKPLLENIDDYSVVTPSIYYFKSPQKLQSAGGYISRFRSGGFFYKKIDKKELEYGRYKYCTFATGCCLMLSNNVINKVGLLPDEYFMYFEDTAYSIMLQEKGIKIKYVPASKIWHKGAASSGGKGNLFLEYYMTRNRIYFAKKNLSYIGLAGLTYAYLSAIKKLVMSIIRRDWKRVRIIRVALSDVKSGIMGQKDLAKLL